jgi:methylated-DNA-[protein]-cysteine S-methyltransferase
MDRDQMNRISIQYFDTALGVLVLGSFQNQLCLCDWKYRKKRGNIDRRIQEGLDADYVEATSDVIHTALDQLEAYFSGNRKDFDIPLQLVGSDFQQRVWKKLLKIPFGSTETYLGLSRKLGDEKAIRSVAAANGANAISIFIPCHRIIGSDGKLTGYGGGIQAKRKLLQLEQSEPMHGQLPLFS